MIARIEVGRSNRRPPDRWCLTAAFERPATRAVARAARSFFVGSRARHGMATVELALISSVLVVILLPMIDIGMGFYLKTQVMTAAQAGADYAFAKGWSATNTTSQTGINAAVMNATTLNASSSPALSSSATPWTYINGGSCSGANCDVWLACKCTDGTTISDPASSQPGSPFKPSDCNALTPVSSYCSGSNNPQIGAYVTVKAHATYTPLYTYLGFGQSVTFTATSQVRVQ
jgi:hypothetical protein